MKPTIAVVGASPNRHKFGNIAVRAYLRQGWDVFPVHPTADVIEGQPVYRKVSDIPVARLDRVSMYLPPQVGVQVIDDFAAKDIGELWFNPGSAATPVVERAKALGLKIVHACSIVAIGIDPHDLE